MLAIEWVGLFLISWSISTLFVHVLVISAVFLERKRAVVNAFYTIYMIWKSTTQRVCTYLQITIMFILGYPLVAFIRPYFITSSFGGVVTQNGLVAAQRNVVYTGATILQFTHGLVVLVLYILILYYVRATRRLSTFTSQVSSKHESTLHKLAMIVCIVEILSVVQQVVQTQILIRDTATIIYIVRTVVYTSIPPYLLLIFSESVWKRVMVFFRL
ncbi:hypothetical protein PENTCL1PPCAC_24904, partial [Pristionchus entomophagus]